MMSSAKEMLSAALDFVFDKEGWGWHEPLLPAIQGLTASGAATAPSGRNSIWQIVEHVALWKEYIVGRMAGEPRRPRGWEKEVDWHPVSEVTEDAWQKAIQRLISAQARVKAELAQKSAEGLDASLPETDIPLYAIFLGILAHDSYHCGQTRYIRAIRGIAREW